ncbi:hypothetical protein [Gulosibacter bifidus]|uniref:Uncharacterized protein n=1 Tax=Gulosibacter bifidus TaxID=272239 RepID=A0ABW5RH29_9MICO|nr:hypothetical protein [Gulosibacter bifidus]
MTDKSGLFGLRAASQQQRVNILTMVAILALVMVLLPMLISVVGSSRREAILAAERDSDDRPQMVVIDPAVDEAEGSVNGVLGAYAMSSAYAPKDEAGKMREQLEKVSSSVRNNDAGETQRLADEARKYFMTKYAPALANRGVPLSDEWGDMNWDTYVAIEEAVAALQAKLAANDQAGATQAVIDLASLLGQGRDEHFQNRVTYVPPPPPPPPAPEPPKTEPPKTEEPKKPEAPKPVETKPAEPKPEQPKPEDPPVDPKPSVAPKPAG